MSLGAAYTYIIHLRPKNKRNKGHFDPEDFNNEPVYKDRKFLEKMYEDLLDFYDRKREDWTFEDYLKDSRTCDIIVPKDEENKEEKSDSTEEKSPTKMSYRKRTKDPAKTKIYNKNRRDKYSKT